MPAVCLSLHFGKHTMPIIFQGLFGSIDNRTATLHFCPCYVASSTTTLQYVAATIQSALFPQCGGLKTENSTISSYIQNTIDFCFPKTYNTVECYLFFAVCYPNNDNCILAQLLPISLLHSHSHFFNPFINSGVSHSVNFPSHHFGLNPN